MLQLRSVRKSYTTADFTQVALDDVSISFRDNEFVAVLGPSGSGKTTLLNIVGGLDHCDSGSLAIDGISTEDFKDRDWDTYRNNRIGFVFQSYNLIPHQSVLSNVELALTLSGVSRAERRKRAVSALDEVGLADHVHKRPGQLSGGQMQRVAIARALINDPEILLADEPTGALDSTTSVAIMGLLSEIARDRLVVMVTHDPQLAEEYATRIVTLKDGSVVDDSDPLVPGADGTARSEKRIRKTSMSFLTAMVLSFNNLMTKKGRTLMTAFAGSIGIIGIAAILALANGVNDYITRVEEETLSVYPLTIQSQGLDFTSLLLASADIADEITGSRSDEGDASDQEAVHEVQMLATMFSSVSSNDLAALKEYLDAGGGGIDDHVSSIHYSYAVTPQIFTADTTDGVRQVNPNSSFEPLGLGSASSSPLMMSAPSGTDVFDEMMADSTIVEQQYDVVAGAWPQGDGECVVVLTSNGGLSDLVLYSMGLRDPAELDSMVRQMADGESVTVPAETTSFTYEEILDVSFTVVTAADYYVHDEDHGVWTDRSGDETFLRELVADGEELRISGIVRPAAGATATALPPGLYYTPDLTARLIERAGETEIVQSQLARPEVNVFSGRTFADEADSPGGDEIDMSSLVTVDEDVLANAITIDESMLQLDPSQLDLSGLELGALDLSGVQVDASMLPELDLEEVAAGVDVEDLIEGIDLDGILSEIDLDEVASGVGGAVDQERASEVAREIALGYIEYCASGDVDCSDPEESFEDFLDSEQGRQILDESQDVVDDVDVALEETGAELAEQVVDQVAQAVREQLAVNAGELESQLQAGVEQYLQEATQAYVQELSAQVSAQISAQISATLQTQVSAALQSATAGLATAVSDAMDVDGEAFLEAFEFTLDEEELTQLMLTLMASESSSFDGNLRTLGYADVAKPSSIDIYPRDFEGKGEVLAILDDYNARMIAEGHEDRVITYTDLVGTLMSSVTDIVNVVSYVLTAFVAISLIVSSIMIGVITYISVLERKKEIGILRSIGASRRDIRRVFNAETLIIGFVAGFLGIATTVLLSIPTNAIVLARFGIAQVAQLPWQAAAILVVISMSLTVLAGLMPSSAASRRDPVEALRSE